MRALGWLIAVSALLITIPRYYRVLERIDHSALTALGMGILLAGGAGYIFHTWATTKRGHSWRLLVAFALNLAYEPVLITPFVLAQLWRLDLAAAMSPGYAVFWSIMVATAPIILVGGVVLAISFQRTATKSERPATTKERPATTKERLASGYQAFECRYCYKAFRWPSEYSDRRSAQNALNAHQYRCKERVDGWMTH